MTPKQAEAFTRMHWLGRIASMISTLNSFDSYYRTDTSKLRNDLRVLEARLRKDILKPIHYVVLPVTKEKGNKK